MKKTIIAATAVAGGGAYLAIHQDKVRLPFLGHVAQWEFRARRNGRLRTAKVLSWYDNLGGQRD